MFPKPLQCLAENRGITSQTWMIYSRQTWNSNSMLQSTKPQIGLKSLSDFTNHTWTARRGKTHEIEFLNQLTTKRRIKAGKKITKVSKTQVMKTPPKFKPKLFLKR